MRQAFKRGVALLGLAILATTASGSAMQTVATGRLMREKLTHAQRVLEALTTSNYALLASESAALSDATKQPAWMVLKAPEYKRQSDTFLRATEDLVVAAKYRDLDLAAMHYVSLTMSCYQCHRYIKNARLAK
jgi:cytochrome c556